MSLDKFRKYSLKDKHAEQPEVKEEKKEKKEEKKVTSKSKKK